MSHRPACARLILLALAGAALACPLAGCGLKGALYLPQQKKTRVPESPGNPAPDPQGTEAPSEPATPAAPDAPSAGDSASRG